MPFLTKKCPFHTKYMSKKRISEFSAKNNVCPIGTTYWHLVTGGYILQPSRLLASETGSLSILLVSGATLLLPKKCKFWIGVAPRLSGGFQHCYSAKQHCYNVIVFHQLSPLGRVGRVVAMSVCCHCLCVSFPCNFFCVVRPVQSMLCSWTGAILISISISSRALKTRMWSVVQS